MRSPEIRREHSQIEKREKRRTKREKYQHVIKEAVLHPPTTLFYASKLATEKAVDGYFNSLTKLRSKKANKIRLLKWEKKAVADLNPGDLSKPETWQKLTEQGWNHKRLYSKYLLDEHVIPVALFTQLADQATHPKNRKSWQDHENDLHGILDTFGMDIILESVTSGITRGALVAMPQFPDEAFWLASVGLTADYASTQVNTAGSIGNELSRIDDEICLALRLHLKTHQGATTSSPLQDSQIAAISGRLFTGSRLAFDQKIAKAKIKTMAAGVGIAQIAHILSGTTWTERAINLGEAAIAGAGGAFLYHKVRKERGGKKAKAYDGAQSAFYQEVDRFNRAISSPLSPYSRAIDIYGATLLPKRRRETKKILHESYVKSNGALETFPWWLTLGSAGAAHVSPTAINFALNGLITGGVIKGDTARLVDEFSWVRAAEQRKKATEIIQQFVNVIENSDYHVPTYLEIEKVREQRDLPLLTSKDASVKMVRKPLMIKAVDSGKLERKVGLKEAISLAPGTVSVVRAEKGTGKTNFGKLVLGLLGNVEGTHVSKGDVDLFQLDTESRQKNFRMIEAANFSSEETMAEQASELLLKSDDTLFKQEVLDVQSNTPRLEQVYKYLYPNNTSAQQIAGTEGMKNKITVMTNLLVSNLEEREPFIESWAKDPLQSGVALYSPTDPFIYSDTWIDSSEENHGISDYRLSNAILNVAFYHYIQRIERKINTLDQSIAFAKRIPGANEATSAGQGSAFGLLIALSEKADVLYLDEPSAHLGDDYFIVASLLIHFLNQHRDAVVIMNEHEESLTQALMGLSRGANKNYVDKLITPSPESTLDNLLWEAKSLRGR